jgi:sugar/nucleoside kinase (ribokinase family)
LQCQDITDSMLLQARHLHVSSIFIQPKLQGCLGQLFKRAKELGLSTSLDPQWDPQEKWDVDWKEVLKYVDVFLPNENEALAITATSSAQQAAETLGQWGNYIVVKLGKKGSLAYYHGRIIQAQPFVNENVVDAVGAGDSFNAGFIFGFIKGADIQACLEKGNLMGALNTTAAGGTGAFTSLDKMQALLRETWNTELL